MDIYVNHGKEDEPVYEFVPTEEGNWDIVGRYPPEQGKDEDRWIEAYVSRNLWDGRLMFCHDFPEGGVAVWSAKQLRWIADWLDANQKVKAKRKRK